MGKIKFLSLIFFLFCLTSKSQTKLSGIVKNTENIAINSASIIVKDNSGKVVAYSYTDYSGEYFLNLNKTGKFNLIVNSMEYEQKQIDIEINSNNEIVNNFILITKFNVLKEVVIKSTRPITVEGDKVIYDVKSFLQGNEQTVEDLLKKIPGLNIDANGTIKVGNQEIEKVMIDGDDMFEKGYKILTKNMLVNPLDKVELLQNYSNNKHLKGIENREKVALNLTLKEDAKRVWFGNILAGYGLFSENQYDAKINLMNFGKKNKYYFLTNLNNIGFDATGDIDNLIRPQRINEPGSIGDNQMVKSLLGIGADLPNLKKRRVNLNNAEILSLNSIFTLSDKVKLKLLGFLNTDENDFFRNSSQQFSVGTSTFTNTEDFIGRKTQITGFGKIDLIFDISKTKTFEYTGKFNQTNEKNRSDLLFNTNLLNEKLNANNQLIDQKIVFTNKFKEKKVFLLSARYINEKTPQNYSVNQFIFNDLFTENANNTKQFSENKMQFSGVEGHLLDKKKNRNIAKRGLVEDYLVFNQVCFF